MRNLPIITFCIPTYNRARKVCDLVNNILEYTENEIEVVVLDNCSTDDTHFLLSTIEDERLVYVRNEINIGSMPNIMKSLTYGRGQYVMLCLDKDWINIGKISDFIKSLKDNEVIFGQCKVIKDDLKKEIVYKKGLSSLLNLAYTSEHPSGLFIENKILFNSGLIDLIIENDKFFAFNTELLKAELSLMGKSKRINLPLIENESLEECEIELSHTYQGTNIYFFPNMIIKTYNAYIENLYNLKLPLHQKRIVLKKLYVELLNSSIVGFKDIMHNKSVCKHHNILTRDVGFFELLSAFKNFSFNFFSQTKKETFFWKIKTFALLNSKIIVKLIYLKFKKLCKRK